MENNNNPAEMSNDDLEKDMEDSNRLMPEGNQEQLNKSTAAEGTLITPEQDEFSKTNLQARSQPDERQGEDHSTPTQLAEKEASDAGSIPDPEALDNREVNDRDKSKITDK
jgi:hypothetical protein